MEEKIIDSYSFIQRHAHGKAKKQLPDLPEVPKYEKIIDSYSFIQRHAHGKAKKQLPDLPEVPKYEKQNSGGIIHLMDTLSKDLELDMSESGYAEKTAQKEYVELMGEN